MPEIFVVHRHDPLNIGDMWSAPSRYTEHFPWLKDATTIDVESDIPQYADRLRKAYVIYGGGGLIGTGSFDQQLNHLMELRPAKFVVWGAGHNNHDMRRISQPSYLENFDMVGLRDYGQSGYAWVPCPSALIPHLSEPDQPRHEIVIYQHWNAKLGPPSGTDSQTPVLKNNHQDLAETIAFLASGRTVVTNSYHGAYWATLLRRRVIVFNPFSSKFFGFRYQVPIVTDSDWKAALEHTQVYSDALAECRARNLAYGEAVRDFFGV